VESEKFMLTMQKYAKPSGNVDKMYIDFENTHTPVLISGAF
jgi:hypothetical protein